MADNQMIFATAEGLGWVREPSTTSGYADNEVNDTAEAHAYVAAREAGNSHEAAESLAYNTVYGSR